MATTFFFLLEPVDNIGVEGQRSFEDFLVSGLLFSFFMQVQQLKCESSSCPTKQVKM